MSLGSNQKQRPSTWPCPHCGFIHRAADLLRLDNHNLQCPPMRSSVPAVPAKPEAEIAHLCNWQSPRNAETVNYQKRKPGRPRLPAGEAKGKIVAIRFTEAEDARLAEAAESRDQNISEWIRHAVLAALEDDRFRSKA